ncbi:MAG: carboxypeptidase-like regulatory domain-containing protein [Leptolyngbyaceae bacterium]|nr:carboxypeptidase-like regulatory domain-containing protein [Leptolyngbyaceae bacterium]
MLPLTLTASAVMGSPIPVLAHGVQIESEPIQSLQMRALFESGDPMANAQVTIYSPADLQTPWQQLSTDENGYFVFTPDPAIPGNWEVQVRQAGHGDLVRVAVDDNSSGLPLAYAGGTPYSGGQSPVQKWGTIAAAVWGFVGTALFFSQRQLSPSGSVKATPSPPSSTPESTTNH